MNSKWVKLGKCTKVHGIKGEFQWWLENSDQSVLRPGDRVLLVGPNIPKTKDQETENYSIAQIRFGNKTICRLTEINDRNGAEAILPYEIFFDRDLFPELEEGEIYLSDLIGLKVKDSNSGEIVGSIRHFYDNGVQDIAVVSCLNGKQLDIPFVDAFIVELSIEAGLVEMIIPKEV